MPVPSSVYERPPRVVSAVQLKEAIRIASRRSTCSAGWSLAEDARVQRQAHAAALLQQAPLNSQELRTVWGRTSRGV
jgi:hypothetical protein